MITKAGFTDEQKKLLIECCNIELEALYELYTESPEFQEELSLKGIPVTAEKLEKIIVEQIRSFEDLQKNPDTFFTLKSYNQRLVEVILLHGVDQFDGNAHLNGIYSKILKHKDFAQTFQPN